ncbi:MAG: hypothetical protein LBF34_01410 [Puniceicoccales bacterium]|nr:hypothetical protein [Puniceicoccales bacterium]
MAERDPELIQAIIERLGVLFTITPRQNPTEVQIAEMRRVRDNIMAILMKQIPNYKDAIGPMISFTSDETFLERVRDAILQMLDNILKIYSQDRLFKERCLDLQTVEMLLNAMAKEDPTVIPVMSESLKRILGIKFPSHVEGINSEIDSIKNQFKALQKREVSPEIRAVLALLHTIAERESDTMREIIENLGVLFFFTNEAQDAEIREIKATIVGILADRISNYPAIISPLMYSTPEMSFKITETIQQS